MAKKIRLEALPRQESFFRLATWQVLHGMVQVEINEDRNNVGMRSTRYRARFGTGAL